MVPLVAESQRKDNSLVEFYLPCVQREVSQLTFPALGSRKILSASGLFKSKCSGVSILGGFQKEVFIFAAIVDGTAGGKGTENTTKRNRFVY